MVSHSISKISLHPLLSMASLSNTMCTHMKWPVGSFISTLHPVHGLEVGVHLQPDCCCSWSLLTLREQSGGTD